MNDWPIRLFQKSILKQRKFFELTHSLGPVDPDKVYLDIGSDNGVISYLLRQLGGHWKSADLDPACVTSIRELVKTEVYQIDGKTLPFQDHTFDAVLLVDILEHLEDDRGFVLELSRILKPNGILVLNVPQVKNSCLRKLRLRLGQTDEKHGHLRQGYTEESLSKLLQGEFEIREQHTYSRFFSEFVDTCVTQAMYILKSHKKEDSGKEKGGEKGVLVTGTDLLQFEKMFRLYSLIYPVFRFFAFLDYFLFFRSGYMRIARAEKITRDGV
jgi:SAM-dependent methyltransferase